MNGPLNHTYPCNHHCHAEELTHVCVFSGALGSPSGALLCPSVRRAELRELEQPAETPQRRPGRPRPERKPGHPCRLVTVTIRGCTFDY